MSQPRFITPGSDGNLWFTEGGQDFTPGPDPDGAGTFHSIIGMIVPTGEITELRVDCDCFLEDIEQGPDDILYFTTNDFGVLGRGEQDRRPDAVLRDGSDKGPDHVVRAFVIGSGGRI